ncbi:MAG: protein-ADP-ribose hydrolase [Clostridiales bacterium]|jgi:O-acetyl-ADP-ribose deacetylase (regulator of RNase III)|nr:protein-ADP-ribose hydrolase [Clostridiales bacterium]
MNTNGNLDYLIESLSPCASIPPDAQGKWLLFRSIVNARNPEPVSEDFLAVQDELLQSIIAERGVTDIAALRPVRDNLYLWRGDITTLKVDAIVNAANSGMLGCFVPNHACIDNAIHTFAGVQLRMECAAFMEKQGRPEPAGQAKITAAYNLPGKYILHTVGPVITGSLTQKHCALLASCYRSCLELAELNGVQSIAFCCISTGEFRFPNEEAAAVAVKTVEDYIAERRSEVKVIFNVFKENDYNIYRRLLG